MHNEHYYGREQSQVKHRILERYLQAFAPIIGSAFEEIVYVDCFAGPWKNRDSNLTDTSFHIALSVFRECKRRGRCKRVRALLIEKNGESYKQLERYAASVTDIEVETRNWDFTEHIADVVSFARGARRSFPFLFIDPTGWRDIRVPLIRPVLRISPGEVLINFMSKHVKRFLDDETKPYAELLGDDVPRLRTLEGDELEDELIAVYANRIRREGMYNYTCAIPVLEPDRDAIHFHLVYGTRDVKGFEVFKSTEAVALPFMDERRAEAQQRQREQASGQRSLLSPLEMYKEDRLQRFHRVRLAAAKSDVIRILESNKNTAYEQLESACLQYSTVLTADLRAMLDNWREKGAIRYLNWSTGQRVPRKDTVIVKTGCLRH